jgi:hypothetical protein
MGAVAVPASMAHASAPHVRAAADAPAITVTPDTNVKDGSKVTVSGTGFPASTSPVYVVECSGTSGQADCDTGTVNFSGSTDAQGSFSNIKVGVHTGTVGDGTCKAGGTCFIAASTSTSGDPSQSATHEFTFGKGSASHKTTTKASFVPKANRVIGTVTSGGKGVKGLKTKLERRAHGTWKKVATLTTHKDGVFGSKKLKKDGKYLVKTPKQKKYQASKSKVVKVKT